jgi:excisionase family DNA binding protein
MSEPLNLQLVQSRDLEEIKDALKHLKEENETWLSTSEACKLIGMERRTLYRYRMKGLLPFARINERVYYKKEDILRYMRKHYLRAEGEQQRQEFFKRQKTESGKGGSHV